MKRKHEAEIGAANGTVSKTAKTNSTVAGDFAPELLSSKSVEDYKNSYEKSGPYKHAVVQPLIADELLRSVRQEIVDNIHFTPKETDIYRIFQSGDLANLDGLPESALSRLPSLLRLRDALYSPDFRAWVSTVSQAGPVSGQKTDMAINVYKPGCHLLCHDDVIGSRRVSYILYLTDPDTPWKAEWGGALRLYPTQQQVTEDGRKVKVPDPEWTKVIPPAWNQLSFFAVQPGESFHDVEEVYHKKEGESDEDGGRVRMAISGWFHIPQEGEEGYEEGLEEKLAEQSSLQQLQAKNDALDLPQLEYTEPKASADQADDDDEDQEDDGLSQADLDFLLKYMTPQYLTPDTVEELNDLFSEESSLQLGNILSSKIIAKLESQILELEHLDKSDERWSVASPPHKHRYLYRQPDDEAVAEDDVLSSIINTFLPSLSFHKWLSLATGLAIGNSAHLARRFRKGLDYTLATAHEEDNMQLEWCLNLTPSKGWTGSSNDDDEGEEEGEENEGLSTAADKTKTKTNGKAPAAPAPDDSDDQANPGGYELYMAGDDADDGSDDGSDDGVPLPSHAGQAQGGSSSTGGGHRRELKKRATGAGGPSKKADPAIYKASGEDEDDGILFTNPAGWNSLSVVLRDKGTLRFVKYVSANAPGDRWDIVGCADVEDDEDGDDDDEEEEEGGEEEDGDDE